MKKSRIIMIFTGTTAILLSFLFIYSPLKEMAMARAKTNNESQSYQKEIVSLPITQDNILLPLTPLPNFIVSKKIKMVITGYSSSPYETQGNPFITASGSRVKDGIVANNLLPFGTKIKIPSLFGDKIFTVEDRMNKKKGYYHLDIWFSSRQKALNFGAKTAEIEVLN